jgi:hypothetical protein
VLAAAAKSRTAPERYIRMIGGWTRRLKESLQPKRFGRDEIDFEGGLPDAAGSLHATERRA